MARPPKTRTLIAAGLALWLAAVGVGFSRLWHYAYTPGPAASAPATWPDAAIRRGDRPFTLVMTLHPECGCSSASLEELSRMLAHTGSRLQAVVLLVIPKGYDLKPSNDLWRTASALPNVTTMRDAEGRLAERFGAHVSGQVVLYDSNGRLRFTGGITPARGHAGDNDGAFAVRHIVLGQPTLAATPVFGCLLAERKAG